MSDKKDNVMIMKPQDSRCRWWAKVLTADELPLPAEVHGARDLPGDYLERGEEIDLDSVTYIIEGEEVSHRKKRGWSYWVWALVDSEATDLTLDSAGAVKTVLRRAGHKNLLAGAGQVAICVRAAHAHALGVEVES